MRKSKQKRRRISAKEFDAKFDAGDDIAEHLDIGSVTKFVNVEFPLWVVQALDREAQRIGIARQALIKLWIFERVEQLGKDSKTNKAKVG